MNQEEKASRVEAISSAYNQRAESTKAAADLRRKEVDEAREGRDTSAKPLPEAKRFVANPDDLRKDVASEEEFSAGLTDGDDDSAEKPAKKTAAKKG